MPIAPLIVVAVGIAIVRLVVIAGAIRIRCAVVPETEATTAADAWKKVTWRQGVKQKLRSRFAAVRVRPAHRDYWRAEPHPEEWLLIEWPADEKEPTKYWLSTLPADTALVELVHLAKHRWIIERDYQELKQELGLGHYEGRG